MCDHYSGRRQPLQSHWCPIFTRIKYSVDVKPPTRSLPRFVSVTNWLANIHVMLVECTFVFRLCVREKFNIWYLLNLHDSRTMLRHTVPITLIVSQAFAGTVAFHQVVNVIPHVFHWAQIRGMWRPIHLFLIWTTRWVIILPNWQPRSVEVLSFSAKWPRTQSNFWLFWDC